MPSATDLARQAARRTVTLNVIVRKITDRGIALYDGATRETVDKTTGEITEEERWHWLPRKFVTRLDGDVPPGKPEDVEVPEWLAQREGLI